MVQDIQEIEDLETGESCLDSETGEMKVTTGCQRKCLVKYRGTKVTISTNDETGEPEWLYEDRFNAKNPMKHPRKFHVPSTTGCEKCLKMNPSDKLSFNMNFADNEMPFKNSQNTKRSSIPCLLYCNSIFLFLSMVCFYPALAAMLSMLLEVSKHSWFHRRDGDLSPEKRHACRIHRSALHKFLSEFCAICQADRMVYMVGKIQDARLRLKGRAVGNGVGNCGMPGTQVLTTG